MPPAALADDPAAAAAPPPEPGRAVVLIGHPRSGSYAHALAHAWADGARAAGWHVDVIDLAALRFDPDVHTRSPAAQPWEPDLERAWLELRRASHWTLVWPVWWSTGPARLHGFLDRVLLPGHAFTVREDHGCAGLLHGRTAHLLPTMDTPPAVFRWVFGRPGIRALRDGTLGLCGVRTTHVRSIGPVTHATPAQRRGWLDRARADGASMAHGAWAARPAARLWPWRQALRLQFYPMTWMAYTLGALAGAADPLRHGAASGPLDAGAYAGGYAMLFFAEAATVFINDLVDEPSDRLNRHFGAFTGGSRVLVDGVLDRPRLRRGAWLAATVAGGCAVLALSHRPDVPTIAAVVALLVLAAGYTLPPLKLAWRGLGECDVALTHSLGVLLAGWLLQGGPAGGALPWLLAAPLLPAVLPAIIVAGLPDRDADAAVGKRTLVVRLGPHRALAVAAGCVVASATLAVALAATRAAGSRLDVLAAVSVPAAAWLTRRLWRLRRQPRVPHALDGVLRPALAYLTLFALLPLLSQWLGAR